MKHIVLLLLILKSFSVYSQDSLVETPAHFSMKKYNTKNSSYNLQMFIGYNTIYPPDAREKCIQGIVYLSFTIDTLGSIISLKNLYPNTNSLIIEAKRVIQLTEGKWVPRTENGIKEPTDFIVPVNFTLYKHGCKNRDSFYNIGEKYFEDQNYEKAISAFKDVLRLSPLDELSIYKLADSYINIQQIDSACHYLSRPIESVNLEDLRNKFCNN